MSTSPQVAAPAAAGHGIDIPWRALAPIALKAGVWLNLAGILVITALAWFYFTPILGAR